MSRLRILVLRTLAPTALALLTSLAGEALAATPTPAASNFKDWTVTCDNLRNCEADGFAVDEADKPAILQLTRGGAAGDPAKIELLLLDEPGEPRGKPLVLAVDGRSVLTIPVGVDGPTALADAQVGPLLGAARNGTTLTISQDGKALGAVSLAGMVAALRFVDDQQKRAGTVTAIIAKGAAPLSAVPPQPTGPVVRRAAAVAQTGLPAKPSAAVKALMVKSECDTEDIAVSKPEAHRLAADKVLWQVPCWSGAYNYSSLFVIIDNKGGAARIARLEGVDDGVAVNAVYDPQTRILSAYNKGRGLGDCGEASEWAWTGEGFALTNQASMPLCQGQTNWPTTFQARVE
jgi:hypothetical protein